MNADEKYLFDLNGYLVIKNVLTPEEVVLANEAIDKHSDQARVRPRDQTLDGGSPELKGEQGRGELGGMLGWKNHGAIRSDTCWRILHLSLISMRYWEEAFVWTIICS